MNLTEFQLVIGQTIMYCQLIENDVKYIYTLMQRGDFDKNYEAVKLCTLGNTLRYLEELDNEDGHPYISQADYDYLKKLANRRNHWCHETFTCFMYEPEFLESQEYKKECYKLNKDYVELKRVHEVLENIRVKLYNLRLKNRPN